MLNLSDDDDEGYQFTTKATNPNLLIGVRQDKK